MNMDDNIKEVLISEKEIREATIKMGKVLSVRTTRKWAMFLSIK